MELMILIGVGSVVFILLMLIAAFIRQLMLRHDTYSNFKTQTTHSIREEQQLEKIRMQMQKQNRDRLTTHSEVLLSKKETIRNLDKKIEEKTKEIEGLIDQKDSIPPEIFALRMADYTSEVQFMREKRSTLWTQHADCERLTLAEASAGNASWDSLVGLHSAVLEALYLARITNNEVVAVENTRASSLTFQEIMLAPVQLLMQSLGFGFGFGGRDPIGYPIMSFNFMQTRSNPVPPPIQRESDRKQLGSSYHRFFPPQRALPSAKDTIVENDNPSQNP